MARKNIGYVVTETDGYYMNQVITGAARAAERLDANLFIFPAKYLQALRKDLADPKRKYEYQNNVLLQYAGVSSIDGLIVSITNIGYMLSKERQLEVVSAYKDIPVMLLCSKEDGFYTIAYDNNDGWCDGIAYILDVVKHTNIGIVSGPEGHQDSNERLDAVIRMAKERGIEISDSQIVHTDIDGSFAEGVNDMLVMHPDINALFCVNDAIATSVYEIVRDCGFTIGEQISILGFDDKEGTEQYDPPLATVHANPSILGEKSMEQMVAILDGKECPIDINVPTPFVLRESAGGPKEDCIRIYDENNYIDYATRYFEMIRRDRQLCMVFRNVLDFTGDGESSIFSRFISSFDDSIFSDALLYLLDSEVKNTNNSEFQLPHWMNLVAYRKDGYVKSNNRGDLRVLTEDIFRNTYYSAKRGTYVVMDVYAREKQYGILVCNMGPEAFHAAELISYQAGIILEFAGYFNDRNKLLSELMYENEQLDSMSYKDELTGIFNRRGFTHTVNEMLTNPDNIGKNLVAIYVDLNYLKLINDCYGHLEGDFAIQKVACAIEYCFADYESMVARIGGDEFVGFALADSGEGELIKKRINKYMSDYNALQERAYDISVSSGVYEICIDNKVNLVEIMNLADQKLYDDKRKKGKFISR